MTQQEYLILSKELKDLAHTIPLKWGSIQNDGADKKIDMFQAHSFAELEIATTKLSTSEKDYFKRRWFLWKCAQCDEYLFTTNTTVQPNPNTKDHSYDIEFNCNFQLRFDVKSTVIPNEFKNQIDAVIQNPSDMIRFFYEKQSRGVRNHTQNRLFVLHHSYADNSREMHVRTAWEYKSIVYNEYAKRINLKSDFVEFKGVKADVLFVFENIDQTNSHFFYAVK